MLRFPSASPLSRRLVAGTVFLAAALVPVANGALAQDYGEPSYVRIARDRSKVVRIPRPADTVVIGNPDIADVVLQDATTLVITGRELGETNLIILDEEGDPIVDETIVVGQATVATVTVFRAADKSESYRCSPDCSAAITVTRRR